jgi:hypothetical protein
VARRPAPDVQGRCRLGAFEAGGHLVLGLLNGGVGQGDEFLAILELDATFLRRVRDLDGSRVYPNIEPMRGWLGLIGAALLLAGCGGSGTTTTTQSVTTAPPPPPGPAPPATVSVGAVKATLYAPTHSPKAGATWNYRVHVADTHGRRLRGKITVQIVDPLGRSHAVTYDDTTRPIARMAFDGDFRDYVQFPKDARGYTLTFRVIANTAKGTVTITFPVTPR